MDLIYIKDVDKSFLNDGFTISYALLEQLLPKIGALEIGESRPITILFGGHFYSNILLKNLNFNRQKWPTHVEMYQVRYSKNNDFAKAMRATFPELNAYIEQQSQINARLGVRKLIKVPEELRCSVAFYETSTKDVWEAVPIYATDYVMVKKTLKETEITEANYENMLLKDEDAHLVAEQHWVKVRKLDRNVCQNLKRLYRYRCQLCGALITAPYTDGDEKVIDAHHIIPFTQSCNNNFSNIMILCPNHHRIVHACHPEFNLQKKEFVFPNGYHEKLCLNKHL